MGQPDAVHYSPGVGVVAWDKEKLNHEAKARS